MEIAVVGAGYVGLVTAACLADFGQHVTCVDQDAERIEIVRRGQTPFFEPGLTEIVQKSVACGRLGFTTDLRAAVRTCSVIFLAVGTPEGPTGEADLRQVLSAASEIAAHMDGYRVIVTKSTVPIGTTAQLRAAMERQLARPVKFDLVSNPEFLREGSAVNDFLRPDRVVIGTNSARAAEIMRAIYRPLYLIETPIVLTDLEAAEMIKYASNAFLAVKISFMNEIANLCDRVGADVHTVAKGMGLDKRIGPKFLHPGPGFGGSCFPKDTRALAALANRSGCRLQIVESAIEVNERQRELLVQKIGAALGGVAGRDISVLGLAFKPNTSDVREAPALHVVRRLAAAAARVRVFDPVAHAEAARALGPLASNITFAGDAYEAARGADALVIMTEWNEFRSLDLERLREVMREPVLIDSRNVLDPLQARSLGFAYYCTGRETAAMAAVPA